MPKLKTSKSILKRIKLTGKGKIRRRARNMNHYNAKEDSNTTRKKRGTRGLAVAKDRRNIIRLLPYINI